MLSRLRYPIILKMKKRFPDGEGGWEEKKAGSLEMWAVISPLSSQHAVSSPKHLEAFSPSSFLGERYEVVIREHPDLRDISEIVWEEKVLVPLTQPQSLESRRGYFSFQALVLTNKEASHG